MKKHTARWARLGVLAVILQGAGCWGDVDIVDGDQPATSVGGSSANIPNTETGSLLGPVCEDSDVQCNGSDVERCVTLGSGSARGWLKIQHCESAALCSEETASCNAKACNFGAVSCNGAVPERCNDDLTARDQLPACASAAYCSPDAEKCAGENKQAPCCLDTPCKAGELRCNNGEIERCKDDQSGLDSLVTCATQKLCELSIGGCLANPASCQCEPPECDAGATRCTGATLERCNADQTDWETVDTCATEELCQLGLTQVGAPACPGVPCNPGEHHCTGGALEVCNAGQTGFELVKDCAGGAAFCDAAKGECRDTPCEIGETSCNGAQRVRCRQDQSGYDPLPGADSLCATARLCELGQPAGICQPPACGAGEFRCSDNQPIRCNVDQTAFANVGAPCLRAELCDERRQGCNFCFPGRRECTPDNRSSRTCAPDGNSFGPLTFCPLGCIPSTGACQTCNLGEFRCQGGLLARCNDGVSFTPLNVGATCSGAGSQVSCNGNQVQTTPCALGCNTQRSSCNQCSAGQRSCTDTTNFATCQANGTFGPAQSCGAGLICAGQGVCSCTPGQASCSGNTLQVCNDTGTALVAGARCGGAGGNVLRTCAAGELTTNTCPSAALCASATGASCAACTEGERSCAAGQPQVCTNGQPVPATACAAGFVCEGAGLCRCAAGDVRCAAGALVQCSADRASFEPAPTCDGATLRSCVGATRQPDQQCGSAAICAVSGSVCAACLDSDPVTCAGSAEVRCVGGALQQTDCDPVLGLSCLDGIGCVSDVIPLP